MSILFLFVFIRTTMPCGRLFCKFIFNFINNFVAETLLKVATIYGRHSFNLRTYFEIRWLEVSVQQTFFTFSSSILFMSDLSTFLTYIISVSSKTFHQIRLHYFCLFLLQNNNTEHELLTYIDKFLRNNRVTYYFPDLLNNDQKDSL